MEQVISLRRLMDDHQCFHDSTQLERFIVGASAWTPWSAYKQCLREIRTRLEGLKSDYRKLQALQIDLDEFEHLSKNQMNHLGRRRFNLDRESKMLEYESVDSTRRDREREFAYLAAQADALRDQIGDVTPARRAQLDAEAWAVRLRAQAAGELAANGRVELNTLDAIRLLPFTARQQIFAEIDSPQGREGLAIWWKSFEPALPPATKAIPVDQVEELITCQSESPQLS